MPRTDPAEILRAYALSLPEAEEAHPWGEIAVKVRGKTFVFLSTGRKEDIFALTVKLPESGDAVLAVHDFAQPAGYGLGKAGWVWAGFAAPEDIPVEMLKSWIDESWRAVAPKTLVKARSVIR